jgi:hypothetical protein
MAPSIEVGAFFWPGLQPPFDYCTPTNFGMQGRCCLECAERLHWSTQKPREEAML